MKYSDIVHLVKESLQRIHLDSGAPLAEYYTGTYDINRKNKKMELYRINGRKDDLVGALKFPGGLKGSLEIESKFSKLHRKPVEVTSRILMQNAQAIHGIIDYLAQNGLSVTYVR